MMRSMTLTRGSLTPIVRARATAACLAILSLAVGLGIIVYDGLITSLPQFRAFWLVLGAGAFYLPGMGYGLAWWGLGSGRAWAVKAGIAAAVLQAIARRSRWASATSSAASARRRWSSSSASCGRRRA